MLGVVTADRIIIADMSWCVFIDESGDHNLASTMDRKYPIFVLAAVIMRKDEYVHKAIPLLTELKIEYFGHEYVILHEHDIRKNIGPFNIFFGHKDKKRRFLSDLGDIIKSLDFKIVATVIDKEKLTDNYVSPYNPYSIGLEFVLERVYWEIRPKNDLHVLLERRGKKEDKMLENEFMKITKGEGIRANAMPHLVPKFIGKKANLVGLQIADLIARPIGNHYLRPDQDNSAYQIVEKKFRRSRKGKIEGWGFKVFPS